MPTPRIAELERRLERDRSELRVRAAALRRRVRLRLSSPGALLAAVGGGFAAGWACRRPRTDRAAGRRRVLRWLPWGWVMRRAWRWLAGADSAPPPGRADDGARSMPPDTAGRTR